MKRLSGLPIACVLIFAFASAIGGPVAAETFGSFVSTLKEEAAKRGHGSAAIRQATAGLKADPAIDKLTRRQPELVKPIGGYIERRVGGPLHKTGRTRVKSVRRTLARIEKRIGVDPYVVAAIWGMETGYGGNMGKSDVFRSLATLAWKRYRGDFFRDEFFDALTIMERERLPRSRFVGSWAGAMGHTQFIPSSFLKYAVDFDGDGTRDLWKSRADALGSAASFLKAHGWVAGQPWGYPVRLPKALPRDAATKPWGEWAKAGVKRRDGGRLPRCGEATLFFPAGAEGPAFLITENYDVIREYNSADSYTLSVALLADRLRGGKRIKLDWPTANTLNKAQRMKVQELLAKKGYDVPNRTGRIIRGVRFAIRDFQRSIGVTADGYPDRELLRQLGG